MEDAEGVELDQSDQILYQGPVFDGTDEDYLIEPEAGFVKGNIRGSVRGFEEEENRICPLVDRKSSILYDIVQQLEEEQLVKMIAVLRNYKKPIVVPREILEEEEGSFIAVRIVDPEEWKKRAEERIIEAELEEQRKVLGDLAYVNEVYREPFYHGWTREVVVRIHPAPSGAELGDYQLTSIGEVFYRDPEGAKIRSMKQIALTLDKEPVEGLSIKNFTFGKAPVGIRDPKKEVIRKINSGRHTLPLSPGKNAGINKFGKRMNTNDGSSRNSAEAESPPGMKLKCSSSRRSIQPPKRYATSQAFGYPEKRSKTGTKKDMEFQSDNEMEMGMLPPKYPRGKEDYGGGGSSPDDSLSRRRGRPTARSDSNLGGSGYNGGSDSALFQISAFHNHSQSSLFDAIDDGSNADDDMYDVMPMMSSENHQEAPTLQENDSEELLPCSIRCPGMTGEIPTLQCKHCLCLYHPECLALPPNLNFKNFLCANCEGERPDETPRASNSSVSRQSMKSGGSSQAQESTKKAWMPKVGEPTKVRKPPPPLLPAFHNFGGKFPTLNHKLGKIGTPPRMNMMQPPPLGRSSSAGNANSKTGGNKLASPMSILRPSEDSMSISPVNMKRGRGRQNNNSSRVLPNLANRNLTITPISIRPRLPVPNLAPMSKTNKPLSLGLLPAPKVKQQTSGHLTHQPKMLPSKGRNKFPNTNTVVQKRIPDNFLKEMKGLKTLQPAIPMVNKGPGGFPPFKRYAQSVVSIGNKKFVAVPKAGTVITTPLAFTSKVPRPMIKKILPKPQIPEPIKKKEPLHARTTEDGTKEANEEQSSQQINQSHQFDSSKEVVEQIFKFLNVKDLLRASRVCKLWNEVASDRSLWKIVRMKNHRISDVEAFTQFLKQHEAEQIDLRKMISADEMDWENLFQSLSDVPALQQIIMGPRLVSAERIATLSQLCPSKEIITS